MYYKFLIYSLFSVIILFSTYQLFFVDKRTYSINKFIWFYILLFWGVVPLIQYSYGVYPWGVTISKYAALKSNSLILLLSIFYKYSYKIFNKKKSIKTNTFDIQEYNISRIGLTFLILVQFCILMFYYIKMDGLKFLRGDDADAFASYSQPVQLIIEMITRAATTFITFIIFILYKNNNSFKNIIFLIISIGLLLLTNFPLAIARYMAGAFYLGLLFIAKPKFKNTALPILALIILFVLIYPALSMVRNISSFAQWQYSNFSFLVFLSEDFDNYAILNMTIAYVEKHGITIGNQLLGVLLFFIPRSIWPSKPVGSGHHVAISNNMSFTNLSCPYVAEGYINFGFIGVIIFAIVLGFIASKLDNRSSQPSKLSTIKLFYPISLGLIFFILRGDLMSSFAYSISFIIAAFIVSLLSKPFLKYKNIG